MKRISSRWTAYAKRVFPVVWLGLLVSFLVSALLRGALERDPLSMVAPVFITLVGSFIYRKSVWNLADSVDDHGTYLVVNRRGIEAKVPIEKFMNVSGSATANARRVTLRLLESSALGTEVVFLPRTSFSFAPFSKIEVAEELMERAYAARGQLAN